MEKIMKRIIITISIIMFFFTAASACEICGCGLGNYYIGMMPQFKHKFIGMRYQYRNFHTTLTNDPTQFSRDFYKTTELWGGWNLTNKWQVIAILPYNFVHQVSDEGVTDNKGLGDIALMANYKIFDKNTATAKNKSLSQQLWFGVGVKLPTGKFNVDISDPMLVALANTQSGSASTDFMINLMYNVKINKVGINTSVSYKMNTSNKDKYSFGNKFSANSILFYAMNKGAVGITPNIGFQYENTAPNILLTQKVAETGGHLTSTAAGMEVNFRKFTLGGNVQLPISQNFAGGQTEAKVRGMLHLTFTL